MSEAVRNAMLLFAKPPVPGLVKTRMTEEKGGVFTPRESADFFRCSFLDVLDLSIEAIGNLAAKSAREKADPVQHYDLIVSTAADHSGTMEAILEEEGPWPVDIKLIFDVGETFCDHFENSFTQVFDLGYDTIVCIGCDLPTMPRTNIEQAFEWLHTFMDRGPKGGAVVAPCQGNGTSLIGYTRNSGFTHEGVYYTSHAAIDAYLAQAKRNDVPIVMLPSSFDVDDAQDLAHSLTLMHAIEYCADEQDFFVPYRTLEWCKNMELTAHSLANNTRC